MIAARLLVGLLTILYCMVLGEEVMKIVRKGRAKRVVTRKIVKVVAQIGKIRPKTRDIQKLVSTVQNLSSHFHFNTKFTKNVVVITAGAFNYRSALYNWVRHMEEQNLQNYVILCFDRLIYDLVGPVHGVLITNGLNYTVSHANQDSFKSKGSYLGAVQRPNFAPNTSSSAELPNLSSQRQQKKNGTVSVISHVSKGAEFGVWSDVDCIWLRSCSTSIFEDHLYVPSDPQLQHPSAPHRVDILGQQGLTPVTISDKTGACLCAGFFMLNPTPTSLFLARAVREQLSVAAFLPNTNICDQSIMNTLVKGMGGFKASLRSLKEYNRENSGKLFSYGPHSRSSVQYSGRTNFSQVYTAETIRRFVDFRVWPFKSPSVTQNHVTNAELNPTIATGLLPYPLFPRGAVRPYRASNTNPKKHINTTDSTPMSLTVSRLTNDSQKMANLPHQSRHLQFVQYVQAGEEKIDQSQSEHTSLDTEEIIREDQARVAAEWKSLAAAACVWHMLTDKTGQAKEEAMRRDGVFSVATGMEYETSATRVQHYLYSH